MRKIKATELPAILASSDEDLEVAYDDFDQAEGDFDPETAQWMALLKASNRSDGKTVIHVEMEDGDDAVLTGDWSAAIWVREV